MIEFTGRGILLDIEGTTSSIRFVYDVMFSFVRRELAQYLRENWAEPALLQAGELLAKDAGSSSFAQWQTELVPADDPQYLASLQQAIAAHVSQLMDQDVKATGLKTLQGLIWKSGFESGEMEAHVYPDVSPALQQWKQLGFDLRIYSSGSINAQKLFFGHSVAGNLLPLFHAHYDTTSGSKKETASYQTITADFDLPAEQILFLSDLPAELDAAADAGLQTGLCQRPENPPSQNSSQHPVFETFDQIEPILQSS